MKLKALVIVVVSLLTVQPAFAAPRFCAGILNSLHKNWHVLRSNSMQEGVPLADQHIAKLSHSNEELIGRWFHREGTRGPIPAEGLKGLYRVYTGVITLEQIRFFESITDFRSLTNAQLRSLVTIAGITEFAEFHVSNQLSVMVALERGELASADIKLWNEKFPERAIHASIR